MNKQIEEIVILAVIEVIKSRKLRYEDAILTMRACIDNGVEDKAIGNPLIENYQEQIEKCLEEIELLYKSIGYVEVKPENEEENEE